MNANSLAQKTFGMRQTGCLLGILGAAALALLVLHPFFLQVTDQAGPFHITLSPVDLDLDGDLDVLVHNMRQPGEFETCAGRALWINQGGLQGGQLGQFSRWLNDIEGGWASMTADLEAVTGNERGAVVWINQSGAQPGQAGTFAASDRILSGRKTHSVRLDDLDRDSDVDTLVVGQQKAALWWNDGSGHFLPGEYMQSAREIP